MWFLALMSHRSMTKCAHIFCPYVLWQYKVLEEIEMFAQKTKLLLNGVIAEINSLSCYYELYSWRRKVYLLSHFLSFVTLVLNIWRFRFQVIVKILARLFNISLLHRYMNVFIKSRWSKNRGVISSQKVVL